MNYNLFSLLQCLHCIAISFVPNASLKSCYGRSISVTLLEKLPFDFTIIIELCLLLQLPAGITSIIYLLISLIQYQILHLLQVLHFVTDMLSFVFPIDICLHASFGMLLEERIFVKCKLSNAITVEPTSFWHLYAMMERSHIGCCCKPQGLLRVCNQGVQLQQLIRGHTFFDKERCHLLTLPI